MFNINEKQLGKFWVENHEKECFHGIIDFNTEDFRLEFDTNFKIPSDDEKVLINGVVENKPISFILINYPLNFKSYDIYDVCMGMHFDTKEDIKFEKIKFKINNISSVIDLTSFKLNSSLDTPLKIKPCESITIKMDNFTIEITVDVLNNHGNWERNGNGRKITFEESINIIIEYNEVQNIGIIYKDITCIKRLFTLLTGKSEITELKGIKENQEIDIITPQILKKFNTNRRIDAMKLNKNNIKKVFKNWLTNYNEMNSVYALFHLINERGVNSNTLFLSYSQILENYHRQKYNGEYLTEKDFKHIRKEIEKNIKALKIDNFHNNQKLQDKIFASIYYASEYSFKDRLIEIFNGLESYDSFNKILKRHAKNNNEPIGRLAKIIKDNRNYYTHHGNKEETVLSGIDLDKLNESLNMIIKLISLKELGFEIDEINRYTTKNRQFKFKKYINLEV